LQGFSEGSDYRNLRCHNLSQGSDGVSPSSGVSCNGLKVPLSPETLRGCRGS
jgi:hypothetical protein